MSPEDTTCCQQAIQLAKSGQTKLAYDLFLSVYHRGNAQDVTLLYWLAFTTFSREEARRTIETIAQLEPTHPKLKELRRYVRNKAYYLLAPNGPVMTCPYCYHSSPSRIAKKVAVGGWIWFAIFFLLFLSYEFSPVYGFLPTLEAQLSEVRCAAFFFLAISIIGPLSIKKRSYSCGHCGITLGDIAY